MALLIVLATFLACLPTGASATQEAVDPPPALDPVVLRVSLPLTFTGSSVASSDAGVLQMGPLAAADDGLRLRIAANRIDVSVVEITRVASGLPTDRVGVIARAGLGDSEEHQVTSYGTHEDVTIDVDGALEETYLRAQVLDPGDAHFASKGLDGVATLNDVRRETQLSYRENPGPYDSHLLVHPGHFIFTGQAPHTTISGDLRLVLHGISFTVAHAGGAFIVETGTWTADGISTVGGLALPGSEQTTRYAVLDLKQASFSLESSAAQDLFVPSGMMQIDVDGKMASPGLAGGIRVGGDFVQAAGDEAQMSGRFTVVPRGTGNGQAEMKMEGEVETLTLGPQRYKATGDAVRATAGIMVAVAALGAAAWHLGKGSVILPLYAKLTRRKILDQGTRNLIFLKIQQDPGVTTKAIAEELDVSWSTASYHLRVLRHMGLVTARRRGRHEHHFVAGDRSHGEQEIMAALRHSTTRRIAMLVAREPGIIQKEICTRLGIAASTASDHLRRLKELNAVREVQDWRTRAYHPGEHLAHLTAVLETESEVLHAATPDAANPASAAVQSGA